MLILSFCAFLYSVSRLLRGLFFPQRGRRHRSHCLTGPRDAGSRRRNEWGALGGVGCCCCCCCVQLCTGMSISFVQLSHRKPRAHVEESWLDQGPPWELEKGPKLLETLRVVGFLKQGNVHYADTHIVTHLSTHTSLCFFLHEGHSTLNQLRRFDKVICVFQSYSITFT